MSVTFKSNPDTHGVSAQFPWPALRFTDLDRQHLYRIKYHAAEKSTDDEEVPGGCPDRRGTSVTILTG
ncbi:MAG: hypothetical protein ACXVKA_17865 [Acidimicrobiia bacterium]